MRILIIESDHLLRDCIAKALRRIHHIVQEASDFNEAEAILFEHLDTFDLIICAENEPDFDHMPSALERMRDLARLRPQLQFRILRDSEDVEWFESVKRRPGAPKATRHELIDSLICGDLV